MSAPEPSTTAKMVAAGIFYEKHYERDGEETNYETPISMSLAELEAALAKGQAEEAEHSRKVEGALKRANAIGAGLDAWIAEARKAFTKLADLADPWGPSEDDVLREVQTAARDLLKPGAFEGVNEITLGLERELASALTALGVIRREASVILDDYCDPTPTTEGDQHDL